jgi:hypothetical protein
VESRHVEEARPRPASTASTLATALLVTLTRPATWLVALAAFLIRGGIIWFLLPIISIPSPVALANTFGPPIVEFMFGGLTLGLVLLAAAGLGVIVLWLVGGGLVAATLELALIREVATDEELGAPSTAVGLDPRAWRVLVVRLVALVPFVLALVYAVARAVQTTYGELLVPSDTSLPIAWRVARGIPDAIILVAATWMLAEIVGGLAARRVSVPGASIRGALLRAVLQTLRHPIGTSVRYLISTAALVAVIAPTGLAVEAAWSNLTASITSPDAGTVPWLAFLAFLALWAGGMVLTGAVCAWRHATWTTAQVMAARGTFGGSEADRPGDWNTAAPSGTV